MKHQYDRMQSAADKRSFITSDVPQGNCNAPKMHIMTSKGIRS